MSQVQQLREQLTQQLQQSTLWQSGSQWYQALPARDRLVVRMLGWLCVVALVFIVIYAPLMKAQKSATLRLQKNVAMYNDLAENAGRFGGAGSTTANADAPLLASVTQQARQAGIALSRYEQDGKSLRIWVDRASFDDAITWLEAMQASSGVVVSQINIDRTDRPGLVDIRATLSR